MHGATQGQKLTKSVMYYTGCIPHWTEILNLSSLCLEKSS